MADGQIILPCTEVADNACPLKPFIMKPYPNRNLITEQLVFNHRSSPILLNAIFN